MMCSTQFLCCSPSILWVIWWILWLEYPSYTCTCPHKFPWIWSPMRKSWNCFCACCHENLADALLLVGTNISFVLLLQWPCPSTTTCFISLHTPVWNFVAIGFNVKDIYFHLVLVVPAVPQPRWDRLACVFLMIRHSSGQAHWSQCISNIYTHLCKFSWSCEPHCPKYSHHHVAAPVMPTATQNHLAISFPAIW